MRDRNGCGFLMGIITILFAVFSAISGNTSFLIYIACFALVPLVFIWLVNLIFPNRPKPIQEERLKNNINSLKTENNLEYVPLLEHKDKLNFENGYLMGITSQFEFSKDICQLKTIRHCQLKSTNSVDISTLINNNPLLETLILDGNFRMDRAIRRTKQLKNISLTSNFHMDEFLISISNQTNLSRLEIKYDRKIDLSLISKIQNLKFLKLRCGYRVFDIDFLKSDTLEELDLSFNFISSFSEYISESKTNYNSKLKVINLKNNIIEEVPLYIMRLPNLEIIDISFNPIKRSNLKKMMKYNSFKILYEMNKN